MNASDRLDSIRGILKAARVRLIDANDDIRYTAETNIFDILQDGDASDDDDVVSGLVFADKRLRKLADVAGDYFRSVEFYLDNTLVCHATTPANDDIWEFRGKVNDANNDNKPKNVTFERCKTWATKASAQREKARYEHAERLLAEKRDKLVTLHETLVALDQESGRADLVQERLRLETLVAKLDKQDASKTTSDKVREKQEREQAKKRGEKLDATSVDVKLAIEKVKSKIDAIDASDTKRADVIRERERLQAHVNILERFVSVFPASARDTRTDVTLACRRFLHEYTEYSVLLDLKRASSKRERESKQSEQIKQQQERLDAIAALNDKMLAAIDASDFETARAISEQIKALNK